MPDNIKIISEEILSKNWAVLTKVTYKATGTLGESSTDTREVYDRGNGAVILLYNNQNNTIILTRQLRIATYFNGNKNGMMIEAPAGKLDQNEPEECIRRETQEETGYTIGEVKKIMEVFMSPGSVTETIHFFIAPYTSAMKTGAGGGLEEEHENIEVLELNFTTAYNMIASGEIVDAKTIMLLQYARLEQLLQYDN